MPIAVRIDPEQRAELLREHSEAYYITDHYAPHRAHSISEDHPIRSEGVAAGRIPFRFFLEPESRK